jgi:hypothetical protein
MRLPFRIRIERQVAVHLTVDLGFHYGRLADLVQLLVGSDVTITGLRPDRLLYHVGMPERLTEATFLVTIPRHKAEILARISHMLIVDLGDSGRRK